MTELSAATPARLARYQWWLRVGSLITCVAGAAVVAGAALIVRARADVTSLEWQADALVTKFDRVSAKADAVQHSVERLEEELHPRSGPPPEVEMRNYDGIERCKLQLLPAPTGEIDPLVMSYLFVATYSWLQDRPATYEAMEALATRWAQVRPQFAYEHFWGNSIFSDKKKDVLNSRSRFHVERDAVFVACLRQVGLLPPR